jgi:predicted nucleic-acid-binding protein
MTAVDTNVVVRLLTGDDPRQGNAARALFASRNIWIAKTVFLECDWVLRKLYGFEEEEVRAAFRRLTALRNVHAEDEAAIIAALALGENGVDFADALHLSSRPAGAMFRSLDRALVRRAKKAGATGIATAESE